METVITSRPEDMDFKDYKAYQRAQKKALKRYSKGQIVWLAKLHPTPEVLNELVKNKWTGEDSLGKLLTKGETFTGKVKDLKR